MSTVRIFKIAMMIIILMISWARSISQELPSKFIATNAASGKSFNIPVAIAMAPGNRIYVAEKKGRVYVIDNGQKVGTPFLDLQSEVLSNESNGLLGIAVDPDFENNPWVYLLYVVDPTGSSDDDVHAFSRLTRYRAKSSNLNEADLSSRQVLIGKDWGDGIIACSGQHVIGALRFALDGTLLFTSGEASVAGTVDAGGGHQECFGPNRFDPEEDVGAFRAQYLSSLSGKLLRIDPETGFGLPSNPYFTGNPQDKQSRVWAYGLRNPYRFGIRPNGSQDPNDGKPGTVYLGDVGWGQYEEVSVANGGENFGWPCYEGPRLINNYKTKRPRHGACSTMGTPENPADHTLPIIHWHHREPQKSNPQGITGNCVTGGAFYTGFRYPSEYQNRYFVADYERGWIRTLEVDDNNNFGAFRDFATLPGGRFEHGVVDLLMDPDTGDIFYVDVATEKVMQISYTGAVENQPPVANASASPNSGKAPLTVHFSGSESFDPEGDAVTFFWDFGTGDTSTEANPVYTYQTPGGFTAQLTVQDDAGLSDHFFLELIVGSEPPVPVITSPANGASYFPHEQIVLEGRATDPDEPEANLQFEWEINLHHNDHIHPATQNFNGNMASIIPENHGDPWDLIYLEIKLRVTDSSNLTRETRSYVAMKVEGETDITEAGTPIASVTNPTGSGNPSLAVIHDAIFPDTGSSNPLQQFDTRNRGLQPEAWIGYEFPTQRRFSKLIFQEGMHFPEGGWFNSMRVQVSSNGSWQDVSSLNSVPPYPGSNDLNYERFSLLFSPENGDAIRLIGTPGGSEQFVSVGELRVVETPFEPPQQTEVVLTPSHDTYVWERNPTRNNGQSVELRVRQSSSAKQMAYLKFDISGLESPPVSATLRLFPMEATPEAGQIYAVANTYRDSGTLWAENDLTWDNAPLLPGAALGSLGAISAADTAEFDVTAAITGNGTYSFAIENNSSQRAIYHSKEGPHPPELYLHFETSSVETPPPQISSFAPSGGPVGTQVIINGSYLAGTASVSFGGVTASHAHALSDSQLEAEVPVGATTGRIRVTTPGGSAESLQTFVVETPPLPADPVITSFAPTNGPAGTEVTIIGTHFVDVTEVSFGGMPAADYRLVSGTEVIATVPATAQTGPVSLTTATGTAISSQNFTFEHPAVLPPVISTFSPKTGFVGTVVTVTGLHFTGATAVKFGEIAALAFSVESDSRILATIPEGSVSGRVQVEVDTAVATSAEDFIVDQVSQTTLTFKPTDDSHVGSTNGGANYGSETRMRVRQTVSSEYRTYFRFDVKGIAPPIQEAKLQLHVNTASEDGGAVHTASNFYKGSSTRWSENGLTWNNAPAVDQPALSAVGAVEIGAVIEFDIAAAILDDGEYCFVITNNSSDQVRYYSKESSFPPELVITFGSGPSQPPITTPFISGFNPASGPVGTSVLITGNHFEKTSNVLFNETPADSFSVQSQTSIFAVVSQTGTSGPIQVVTDSGSAVSAESFFVNSVGAEPSTLLFEPTDDTSVWSQKPTANYGSAIELRVRHNSSAQAVSYFKFSVAGTNANVVRATLSFFVNDGSDQAGSVYLVSNNYANSSEAWRENALLWNNAPAVQGEPLSSFGQIAAGGTVEFDVTQAISGDGVFSFAVANESNDALMLAAKESAQPCQLTVETGGTGAVLSKAFGETSEPDEESSQALPEKLELFANFPNPFNRDTQIRYALPEDAVVRVIIYNILGRPVRILVDENQTAGLKSTRWDGRNDSGTEVSSGLYFVRLEAGRAVSARKLILQK